MQHSGPSSIRWSSRFARLVRFAICGIIVAATLSAAAATLGISPPSLPLTRERIVNLPQSQRAAWLAYLDCSERKRQVDKETFAAELKHAGLKQPLEPAHSSAARSIPLNRPAAWYATPDARHIGDVIVSFQTPAGGWGKNLDMSTQVRRPGEHYGPDNVSRMLAAGDYDAPAEIKWSYIGTIDNDATTTQLKFLAKVISAIGSSDGTPYRAAFQRGIEYLLSAQYPNGGWPQVWPLEGGYHDGITYNDDAMIQVIELLRRVSGGEGEFSFVSAELRKRAAESFARGIDCILATQIVQNGTPTIWPQQADPLTLQPASARNFEPPAATPPESTRILLLLMDLPDPAPAQSRAIKSAVAWFRKTAIHGQRWGMTPQGRGLTADPNAPPIWARYYQIGTDGPIFGDRDKSIHDTVDEISKERRNGYRWYSSDPQQALDRFDRWAKEHPETQ